MFRRGVFAIFDFSHVGLQGSQRRRAIRLKVLDESRRAALRDIENVIQHQYLAINIRPSADSDNRNVQRFCYNFAHFVRDALKQDDISTGVLQAFRRG